MSFQVAFASCIPMAANPHHCDIWPAVSVHPGWLQIPDPPTSVSQVRTLQACATKPNCFIKKIITTGVQWYIVSIFVCNFLTKHNLCINLLLPISLSLSILCPFWKLVYLSFSCWVLRALSVIWIQSFISYMFIKYSTCFNFWVVFHKVGSFTLAKFNIVIFIRWIILKVFYLGLLFCHFHACCHFMVHT